MPKKTIYDDIAMYLKNNIDDYWKHNEFEFDIDVLNLRYYLDIKPRIKEGHFNLFNKEGIPLTKYNDENVQINPVNISAYGLGCLDMYLETNEKEYLDKFLLMANWLCENQEMFKTMGVWYYRFDWKYMENPWISGMAQGEALSTLSRAYKITKKHKYLDCAKNAFNCFIIDVEDGGVVSYLNDSIFFEEYPHKGENTYVLNGFIYAIFGIIDYYIVSRDEHALYTFQNATKTLNDNLHLYDNKFWSLYNKSDNNSMIASYMYHNLHIVQLRILYKMTQNKVLKDYCEKWDMYRSHPINKIRALSIKVLEKLRTKF